jgi:hypothetical protein
VVGNPAIEETRRLETASTQTMSASADEEIWNLQPAEAGFVCVAAV